MASGLRKFIFCFFIFIAGALSAQSPEAAIAGTVSDASEARVTDAKIAATARDFALTRSAQSGDTGEFRLEALPPGKYEVRIEAPNFAPVMVRVAVTVGSTPTVNVKLKPGTVEQSVEVEAKGDSVADQAIETTGSEIKSTIGAGDLRELPLAHRSFANIAYLAPMTQPVEPSDPTKARITAVSFGGSSGLNLHPPVGCGDDNHHFIPGFLPTLLPHTTPAVPRAHRTIQRRHLAHQRRIGDHQQPARHQRLARSPLRILPRFRPQRPQSSG